MKRLKNENLTNSKIYPIYDLIEGIVSILNCNQIDIFDISELTKESKYDLFILKLYFQNRIDKDKLYNKLYIEIEDDNDYNCSISDLIIFENNKNKDTFLLILTI